MLIVIKVSKKGRQYLFFLSLLLTMNTLVENMFVSWILKKDYPTLSWFLLAEPVFLGNIHYVKARPNMEFSLVRIFPYSD